MLFQQATFYSCFEDVKKINVDNTVGICCIGTRYEVFLSIFSTLKAVEIWNALSEVVRRHVLSQYLDRHFKYLLQRKHGLNAGKQEWYKTGT